MMVISSETDLSAWYYASMPLTYNNNYCAGLDMFSVWITSAYHSKRCTGRYQDTREDQVDQERTGGAQSTKTYKRWGSPGRKYSLYLFYAGVINT